MSSACISMCLKEINFLRQIYLQAPIALNIHNNKVIGFFIDEVQYKEKCERMMSFLSGITLTNYRA
jgi:hypothetical protein